MRRVASLLGAGFLFPALTTCGDSPRKFVSLSTPANPTPAPTREFRDQLHKTFVSKVFKRRLIEDERGVKEQVSAGAKEQGGEEGGRKSEILERVGRICFWTRRCGMCRSGCRYKRSADGNGENCDRGDHSTSATDGSIDGRADNCAAGTANAIAKFSAIHAAIQSVREHKRATARMFEQRARRQSLSRDRQFYASAIAR